MNLRRSREREAPSPEWHQVCRLADLEVQRGAAALVHGQAVALFRTAEDRVYAVSNHDPFCRSAAIARGIVGERDGVPFVGSPTHGHTFDLRTGVCLDDAQVTLATFEVVVREGLVMVGHRRVGAA